MRRANKSGSPVTVVISDASSEGWQVLINERQGDGPRERWFRRRDCARAFAQGVRAGQEAWSVIDKSTSRSAEAERAKSDALFQLDLFKSGHGTGP